MTARPSGRPAVRIDTEEIVSIYRRGSLTERTSQNRYLEWRRGQPAPIEFLVPRMFREITPQWPEYMSEQRGHLDLSRAQLVDRVRRLDPWLVPFRLGHEGFWSAYARYLLVGLLVGGLTAIVLTFFVEALGLQPTLGQALALLVVTPVAFVLIKRWTFQLREPGSATGRVSR